MPNGAPQAADTSRVVFADDFSGPLSARSAGALWRLRPVGPFPAGDGILSTGREGLVVVPTGTDPGTGDPAFADSPERLGDADHLRWALMANRTSTAGFPGFDTGDDSWLTVSTELSLIGYGLQRHPYGEAVRDPGRDLRLGAGMLVCVDLETGIVLDFIVTDRCVLAVYERLALPGTTHGAFSFAVPVADREPEDVHALAIRYEAAAAHWYVGGVEVLSVDALGLRSLDARFLKRDNGLAEQVATPRQMTCGLSLFADRLFGQGFRLNVRSFEVRAGRADHNPWPGMPAGAPRAVRPTPASTTGKRS